MKKLADEFLVSQFLKSTGSNIGILHNISRPNTFNFDYVLPGLEMFFVEGVDQRRLGGSFRADNIGFGQDEEIMTALIRSIGEGVERVYSGFLPEGEMIWASHQEMAAKSLVLPLEHYQLVRTSQEAPRVKRFTPDAKMQWSPTEFIERDGKISTIYFPLPLLSLNLDHSQEYEIGTTNGVALGRGIEMASLAALMELVERDALMRMWWLRKVPKRIHIDEVKDFTSGALKQFVLQVQDQLRVFDLTETWGIPIAAAFLQGKGEHQPLVYLGASIGRSFPEALNKCMLETSRVWSLNCLKRKYKEGERSVAPPYEESVLSFSDIEQLSFQQESKSACEFMRSTSIPLQESSKIEFKGGFQDLVHQLAKRGVNVYRSRYTPDFLKKMDLHIVRVRSPQMISLNCAHAFRPWGNLSLAQIPEEELNPFPQPFL